MKYLSVASGIEAASVAWEPLGFEPMAFSEIDKFPSAVLKQHYPGVPNAGDFTTIGGCEYGAFDILVGGTPCQSFSVAGLRGGMGDARGNLALEFIRLAYRSRPQWVLWENVPGVLSSSKGADFASFLSGLTGVDLPVPPKGWKNTGVVVGLPESYSVAWRVLDAQYFGVPQRRRRLFVVGHLGDWRRAAAVLLEPESLCGYPPPSRSERQDTPGGVEVGPSGGRLTDVSPTLDARCKDGFIRNQLGVGVQHADTVVPHEIGGGPSRGTWWDGGQVSQTLDAVLSKGQCMPEKKRFPAVLVPDKANTLTQPSPTGGGQPQCVVYGIDEEQNASEDLMGCLKAREAGGGFEGAVAYAVRTAQTSVNGHGVAEGVAHTLDGANGQAVCFESRLARNGRGAPTDVVPCLKSEAISKSDSRPLVTSPTMAVRRITPIECERLQGFPDNWTLVKYNGKPAKDGPRYKAIGNSMAIPCMAWIGERIQRFSDPEFERSNDEQEAQEVSNPTEAGYPGLPLHQHLLSGPGIEDSLRTVDGRP